MDVGCRFPLRTGVKEPGMSLITLEGFYFLKCFYLRKMLPYLDVSGARMKGVIFPEIQKT